MIAVVFEVRLREGGADEYLRRAAELREQLERIDGFVSVERFGSLAEPDRMLSLSFWRDEAAVARWREHEPHKEAQAAGRASLFLDYRIRVATVTREYGMHGPRESVPPVSPGRRGV